MRRVLFLLTLAVAALVRGGTVDLKFSAPADRRVFFAASPPADLPPDAKEAKTLLATIETKGPGRVYVLDLSSNRIASRDVRTGEWAVSDAEFTAVAEARVQATSDAGPLASGNVTIRGNGRNLRRILDPSANGEVRFFFPPPGRAEITVETNVDGKPKATTVVVNDPGADGQPIRVAIVGSAPAATPVAPVKAAPKPPPIAERGAGSVVGYLLGLLVVGGIGYAALTYYRQNKDRVEGQLEKLGVQIPKPEDAPLATADLAAPMPAAKPAPPEKIVLSGSAPDPIVAAPIPTGRPALRTPAGDVLDLDEGETVVGREPGLGLSLTQEGTVSRRHATLTRRGSTVTLADLGSSNGTTVNGARLTSPTVLRPGDEVRFGTATFRYEG